MALVPKSCKYIVSHMVWRSSQGGGAVKLCCPEQPLFLKQALFGWGWPAQPSAPLLFARLLPRPLLSLFSSRRQKSLGGWLGLLSHPACWKPPARAPFSQPSFGHRGRFQLRSLTCQGEFSHLAVFARPSQSVHWMVPVRQSAEGRHVAQGRSLQ